MDVRPVTVTLVAIAKNESFYLTEWLAYHLGIGFQNIIVFNNDSTDETMDLLTRLAILESRIIVIDWPSRKKTSPQNSAYNHALALVSSDWIAFLDIDEFFVLSRQHSVASYLEDIPADVSEIHINWRGFGSSDVGTLNYELVMETFTSCSPELWANNYHYKSVIRRSAAAQIYTDSG